MGEINGLKENPVKKEVGIKYFDITICAGFPSPAGDYLEETIDLNEVYVEHPQATYFINCQGNSMKDAYIPPKARLIVDRSLTAKSGDIIVASVEGAFTVKYLKLENGKCWLLPANKNYRPILVTEEMGLDIFGVVTTIMIKTKEL